MIFFFLACSSLPDPAVRDPHLIEVGVPVAGMAEGFVDFPAFDLSDATTEQMLMFLTRLGFNSKAVITGDPTQIDLPSSKRSGLIEAKRALARVDGIALCEFERRDVLRHQLVQRIVEAYEALRKSND